jgi:IS5 family transposase
MEKQMSFAQSEDAGKKKVTRRERFLGEMEKVVPWSRLCGVIEPYYPKGERGRPPIGIERMLRIYFLQQWYALADEALEDALYDSQAMRSFAGIDLSVEAVPDATTLLKFRHLLEAHDLTARIFAEVGALLSERKLLMREGTIVDATIIAAPSKDQERKQRTRPRDAPDQERQPMVFRDEGAHRRRCAIGAGAYGHGHRGERGGHRAGP